MVEVMAMVALIVQVAKNQTNKQRRKIMCWVNIVIPIVSSLLGGLLTLIGVAWTI